MQCCACDLDFNREDRLPRTQKCGHVMCDACVEERFAQATRKYVRKNGTAPPPGALRNRLIKCRVAGCPRQAKSASQYAHAGLLPIDYRIVNMLPLIAHDPLVSLPPDGEQSTMCAGDDAPDSDVPQPPPTATHAEPAAPAVLERLAEPSEPMAHSSPPAHTGTTDTCAHARPLTHWCTECRVGGCADCMLDTHDPHRRIRLTADAVAAAACATRNTASGAIEAHCADTKTVPNRVFKSAREARTGDMKTYAATADRVKTRIEEILRYLRHADDNIVREAGNRYVPMTHACNAAENRVKRELKALDASVTPLDVARCTGEVDDAVTEYLARCVELAQVSLPDSSVRGRAMEFFEAVARTCDEFQITRVPWAAERQ
jgi:hypothetical protein